MRSNSQGHFLFLGTGASMGIPVIGCKCSVCQSQSPCNRRLRPSALVTLNNTKLLIDCGPDFRAQALLHNIDDIDALLVTHTHHDHIAGIDELRVYFMKHKNPLPCLLSAESARDLKKRFSYIFDNIVADKLIAKIALTILEKDRGEYVFQNIKIKYLTYEQGGMPVTGFRFGNLAYISDISKYPQEIFEDLKGTEILIVSALRESKSQMHFSVDEAVEFSQKVGASQTWLTHIAHELDHEATNARLPSNVRMAYDGLELIFSGELNASNK